MLSKNELLDDKLKHEELLVAPYDEDEEEDEDFDDDEDYDDEDDDYDDEDDYDEDDEDDEEDEDFSSSDSGKVLDALNINEYSRGYFNLIRNILDEQQTSEVVSFYLQQTQKLFGDLVKAIEEGNEENFLQLLVDASATDLDNLLNSPALEDYIALLSIILLNGKPSFAEYLCGFIKTNYSPSRLHVLLSEVIYRYVQPINEKGEKLENEEEIQKSRSIISTIALVMCDTELAGNAFMLSCMLYALRLNDIDFINDLQDYLPDEAVQPYHNTKIFAIYNSTDKYSPENFWRYYEQVISTTTLDTIRLLVSTMNEKDLKIIDPDLFSLLLIRAINLGEDSENIENFCDLFDDELFGSYRKFARQLIQAGDLTHAYSVFRSSLITVLHSYNTDLAFEEVITAFEADIQELAGDSLPQFMAMLQDTATEVTTTFSIKEELEVEEESEEESDAEVEEEADADEPSSYISADIRASNNQPINSSNPAPINTVSSQNYGNFQQGNFQQESFQQGNLAMQIPIPQTTPESQASKDTPAVNQDLPAKAKVTRIFGTEVMQQGSVASTLPHKFPAVPRITSNFLKKK